MKDKYIFYIVCSFAVLTICAIGIGYATDTLPLYKQDVKTTPSSTIETTQISPESLETGTTKSQIANTPSKKKDCNCCKERMEKFRERMEKFRNRKTAARSTENTSLK